MALPMATQSEMVEELAEQTGFPKGEVRHLLEALQNFIVQEVGDGNRVKVAGVVIEPKLKKATKKRKGRNPATGEEVMIAAKPASVKLKARVVAPLSRASLPSPKRLASKS
jgi:nucleoid DNA-binding protein